MGAVTVTGITADDFPRFYEQMKWAFDSFAKRSFEECTPEDLAGQVMARTSQCWVAVDRNIRAVALTEVREGREKSVWLTHCAGHGREDWQSQMVDTIREWAKSVGATTFGTVNRPGWTPFLREMGLRETHRVMEQKIG